MQVNPVLIITNYDEEQKDPELCQKTLKMTQLKEDTAIWEKVGICYVMYLKASKSLQPLVAALAKELNQLKISSDIDQMSEQLSSLKEKIGTVTAAIGKERKNLLSEFATGQVLDALCELRDWGPIFKANS